MIKVAYGLVLLCVSLLYLQLILGRISRWSRNWFVVKGAEAANKLSPVVRIAAMGVMPHEHSAAVWILFLIALDDSVAAYDAESGEFQKSWTAVYVALFLFRAGIAVSGAGVARGTAGYLAYGFLGAMVCACAGCNICIGMARTSKCQSKKVADKMTQDRDDDERFTGTLVGCRYVVDFEPVETTVEAVYNPAPDGGAGRADSDPEIGVAELGRWRELCLSFALFRLLYSRLQGESCYEAELCPRKTRAFIFDWLLRRPGGAGFDVVEAELGFLHDHIHGGHVLWSPEHRGAYYALAALRALLLYVVIWPLFVYTKEGSWSPPPRPVVALLLLHVVFDLLQMALYCGSDRWIVSSLCHRPARPRLNRLSKIVAALVPSYYWQGSLGQYSLFADIAAHAPGVMEAVLAYASDKSWLEHGARECSPVPLPQGLKASIACALLERYDAKGGEAPFLRWTCDPTSDPLMSHPIKTILKWHIVTGYLDWELRDPAGEDRRIAVALSNYCAYLVAFRPELLPERQSRTARTFQAIWKDAWEALRGAQSEEEVCWEWHRAWKTETFKDGLRLGQVLKERKRDQIWAILKIIWVRLILSLVPHRSQDDTYAKNHAKYLAQGGEFATQLWAMLSHVDIVHHHIR